MDKIKESIYIFFVSFFLVTSAYLFSIDAWFVLDDYNWLRPTSIEDLISFFYQSWGHGNAYRPLMRISFFLDYTLFGENPVGWHFHSYVLHSANVACLFGLINFLIKKRFLAGLTALLFAVAPWGHANIAWISARTYLLATFFYLSALGFAFLYIELHKKKFWVLSILFFVLGLMSYEATVSFPLIFGLLLFHFRSKWNLNYSKLFFILTSYIAILFFFLIIRYLILNNSLGSVNQNHANYIHGLLINAKLIYGIFFKDCALLSGAIIVVFFISLSLIIFNDPAERGKKIAGVSVLALMAFFVYLPFSQINGVAHRFLYMMQIPYIFLIASSLYTLLKFEKRLNQGNFLVTYILIGFFLLTNIYFTMQISKEWKIAGNISQSIPNQVKLLYPEKPQGFNFVFQSIPNNYKRAGIFLTYFEYAIMRQYDRFDGAVFRTENLLNKTNFKNQRIDKPAKYFLFNSYNKKIIELTQIQWEVINGLSYFEVNEQSFDNEFYLKFYPDVGNHPAYRNIPNGGWLHWSQYGKKEGRVAVPKSVSSYVEQGER